MSRLELHRDLERVLDYGAQRFWRLFGPVRPMDELSGCTTETGDIVELLATAAADRSHDTDAATALAAAAAFYRTCPHLQAPPEGPTVTPYPPSLIEVLSGDPLAAAPAAGQDFLRRLVAADPRAPGSESLLLDTQIVGLVARVLVSPVGLDWDFEVAEKAVLLLAPRLSQFWGRELLSLGPVGRVSLGSSCGLWTRSVLLDEGPV